jgi:parkin
MSFIINAIKNILHRMLQFLSFSKKTISNSLSIYIKTNNGNTLSVDLDPNWDIKDVKEFVAPQLGLDPGEVKIIFAGKELGDSITISECDLGQQSTLHAIKVTKKLTPPKLDNAPIEESDEGKPLCETLSDLSFSNDEVEETSTPQTKVHFFVYCPTCKSLKNGKLRVRCHFCKYGAFTVHADPQNWTDVLEPKRITGLCENSLEQCANVSSQCCSNTSTRQFPDFGQQRTHICRILFQMFGAHVFGRGRRGRAPLPDPPQLKRSALFGLR